ncbi:MAG: hypothetical protein ISR64_01425 [Deltaproteobacteria bacterium]|nr:hypothetical protein [Deltaproteobacteria bacterium]
MGVLSTLDYTVIATYLAVSLVAATNFSIDTPQEAITQYVAEQGVAGVWFFWSNAISALLAAFLFARLWSRADVVTDAELIEKRYSGPEAAG